LPSLLMSSTTREKMTTVPGLPTTLSVVGLHHSSMIGHIFNKMIKLNLKINDNNKKIMEKVPNIIQRQKIRGNETI
jgi:hypothetical protein